MLPNIKEKYSGKLGFCVRILQVHKEIRGVLLELKGNLLISCDFEILWPEDFEFNCKLIISELGANLGI